MCGLRTVFEGRRDGPVVEPSRASDLRPLKPVQLEYSLRRQVPLVGVSLEDNHIAVPVRPPHDPADGFRGVPAASGPKSNRVSDANAAPFIRSAMKADVSDARPRDPFNHVVHDELVVHIWVPLEHAEGEEASAVVRVTGDIRIRHALRGLNKLQSIVDGGALESEPGPRRRLDHERHVRRTPPGVSLDDGSCRRALPVPSGYVARSGAGDETRTRDIQLGRNVLKFVFRIAPEPLMSAILEVLKATCESSTGAVLPGTGTERPSTASLLPGNPYPIRTFSLGQGF